jgi:tetratricopeptide (TPR) repeat protein
MRRRAAFVGAVALALASVDARPARAFAPKPSAAEVQRAEELFENGRKLYGEGSYEAAATAFEQAYELSGNIDMLYNAALAYDRADAFERAIAALDRYRALAPAAERDKLDERKQSLQLRLEKQREREAAAADDAAGPDGSDRPYPEGSDPKAGKGKARAVGPAVWALGGSTIAAFAFAAGFGGASIVRAKKGRAHCTADDPPLCDSGARTHADRSRTYALVADVAFAVGGALAIATIAVVAVKATRFRNRPGRAAQDKRASKPVARLEPAGDGLRVRF